MKPWILLTGATGYIGGRLLKLPGRAWLEFEVTADANGSLIRQTAIFDPVGLGGLLYWYLVYPLHQLVFAGMLRGIAYAAEHASRKT